MSNATDVNSGFNVFEPAVNTDYIYSLECIIIAKRLVFLLLDTIKLYVTLDGIFKMYWTKLIL